MKRRNTIKTRFKYIEKIHGFCKGELSIVAGRPGVGKTSFITNVIEDALFFENQNKNVLLFSLELKSEAMLAEMIRSRSKGVGSKELLDDNNILKGSLAKRNYVAEEFKKSNIYIDHTCNFSVDEINEKARKLNEELRSKNKKLDLIAVDYLQLLRGGKEFETRELEVKDILKKLKILAIELEIPVIITAQLSRDGSFIDCPAIEYYADFIIKIEDYSTYMKSKCMFFRMMRYDVDDIILPMKFIREYRCFEHIEI